MKQLLMCLYGLFMATCVKAQTMVESKTYATGETREFIQDISTKRRITGGTKLLITYEGQWDNKMKSAFEYACKIWEECIPTTLPIKIKAVMGVFVVTVLVMSYQKPHLPPTLGSEGAPKLLHPHRLKQSY